MKEGYSQSQLGFRTFTYTTENGLPSNGIKGMQWDENTGFLWIATEAGISRFNGIDFTNFTRGNTNFITAERIRFMVRNRDNQIRVADMDGNLLAVANNTPYSLVKQDTISSRYAKDWDYRLLGAAMTDRFLFVDSIPFAKRISFPFCDVLSITPMSALLFNQQGTILSVDMEKRVLFDLTKLGRDNLIGFLFNDKYYIQKRNKENLFLLDTKTNTTVLSSIKLPSKNAKIVWENGMQYPIALDEKNAWVFKNSTNGPSFELICSALPNLGLIKYVQYSQGRELLFLGTASRGFAVIKTNRIRQVKKLKADTKELSAYYSQWEFKPGTILTNEGHVIGDGATADQPIKGRFGFSIYEDGDSLVWYSAGKKNKIGNYLTLLNRQNKTVKYFERIEIYNVFAQSRWQKNILIGNHKGLGILQGDSLQLLFGASKNKNEESTAFSILEQSPGVFSMTSCSGWIIFNLTEKKADTLLKIPGYCVRSQIKIGGYTFIGTYGKGIYVYKDGKIRQLPIDKNSFLLYTHCFVPDKYGFIWMSTNRGLFKAQATEMINAFEKGSSNVYYHYLGKNDGMDMTELNGGCSPCALRMKDGTISFPTMDGLLWVVPGQDNPLMPDGPLYIDKITVDEVEYSSTTIAKNTLPTNFKSIQVYLGFSAWANTENIYIEYKLGDNPAWKTLTPAEGSVIRLGSLPGGDYTLYIRKRNGFGAENYFQISIPLRVNRPWYTYRLSYFLLAILLTGLIYLLSRFQNRRLIRRQRELERMVDAKTKDLKDQNNILEKSNRINNRLISIISHDIITPLKFLHSAGKGLLKKRSELPDETQSEILNEIINTSQDLHLLSTNILNWIKYQSENKRLIPEPIYAEEATNQIIGLLTPMAREKDLKLINIIDPNILINQLAEPLRILIYNLLLNSIHYSKTGTITVDIKEMENTYVLTVSDQGIGMSEEKIESLLNDSTPIQDNKKEMASGHGLGYLIIRDVVNWMGARIAIRSTPGKGTEVRVEFQNLSAN
jgi:signal transduction histidine kinase